MNIFMYTHIFRLILKNLLNKNTEEKNFCRKKNSFGKICFQINNKLLIVKCISSSNRILKKKIFEIYFWKILGMRYILACHCEILGNSSRNVFLLTGSLQ